MVGADEGVDDDLVERIKLTDQTAHSDTAGGHGAGSERHGLASHVRTAAMLFVVTVVFVLTFAPAFLMSLEVVSYNRLVFHIYFVNNVANPVIYSFMNSYFRQKLVAMFCRFTSR